MAENALLLLEDNMPTDNYILKIDKLNNNVLSVDKTINDYSVLLDDVFSKIKAVDVIANKTNLLAINASIETIHASDLLESFERIVVNHLRIQGRIIAKLISFDPDFLLYKDPQELVKECEIEELFITDEDGIVIFSSAPAYKNSRLNSPDILRILKQPELEIALPAVPSGNGGAMFKVVGVSRRDQRGIIQIGSHFVKPKGQLAINGFAVVAGEAKRLSDQSKEVSAKISVLTSDLSDEIVALKKTSAEVTGNVDSAVRKIRAAIEENRTPEMTSEEFSRFISVELSKLNDGLKHIRQCFKNVVGPLSLLLNIARQTNLLGVRAAIEAAHSTNDKQDFDALITRHMTSEAKLASLAVERKPDITVPELAELAKFCCIDEFWITDEKGVVDLTIEESNVGFVFQNEGQTAPFMRILADNSAVVSQPPSRRTLDGKIFKYIGVGRKDKPGIFQVGLISKLYGDSTAEGFSVVSKQIKDLAEQSREMTTNIEELLEKMDVRAGRAMDNIKSISRRLN